MFMLFAFGVMALLLVLYAALSLTIFAVSIANITQLIVCSIAFIGEVFFINRYFHQFGWDIFTQLGDDANLRKLYGTFQVFVAMIKFDMVYAVLLVVSIFTFFLSL